MQRPETTPANDVIIAMEQIRKVYELLVQRHPQYHNFRTENDWAFAQKKNDASPTSGELAAPRKT